MEKFLGFSQPYAGDFFFLPAKALMTWGFCARDSLQHWPKITVCLNVLVFVNPLLLQQKVRNQATSITLVFVSAVL